MAVQEVDHVGLDSLMCTNAMVPLPTHQRVVRQQGVAQSSDLASQGACAGGYAPHGAQGETQSLLQCQGNRGIVQLEEAVQWEHPQGGPRVGCTCRDLGFAEQGRMSMRCGDGPGFGYLV